MQKELLFIDSIEKFSYVGIFIFAIFSGYIIPIPEEIILIIAGFMVSAGFVHFFLATIVVFVAFVIGDNILYRLVYNNNSHVSKFINEVLSLKIISNNKEKLERHINTTIFVTRFIPFMRFVGPVFAGYVKAPAKKFTFFNTLALLIYTPFLMWIGYFFHDYFTDIVNQIGKIRHIAIIVIWVIIGLLITRITDYISRKYSNK